MTIPQGSRDCKDNREPQFWSPSSCRLLALESAEREHTESLDLSCSLGPTSKTAGRVLGMCRWHVLRTVEFASEMFGGGFSPKIRFVFINFSSPKISPTNSAANFAGKFHWKIRQQISPANFARQISPVRFRRRTSQNVLWLSSLLLSFGLSCLRT